MLVEALKASWERVLRTRQRVVLNGKVEHKMTRRSEEVKQAGERALEKSSDTETVLQGRKQRVRHSETRTPQCKTVKPRLNMAPNSL